MGVMKVVTKKLPPLTEEDIRKYIVEYRSAQGFVKQGHYFIDEFDELVGPYLTKQEAIAALEAYQP